MSAHLAKIALVLGLAHGYRVVGRNFGPRWAGLVAGLPCASAVALVGGGCDRGVEFAVAMAEAASIGLVGSATLTLAFAWASGRGWSLAEVVAAAVGSHVAAAGVAGMLAGPKSGGGCLATSALGVLMAAAMAARLVVPGGLGKARSPSKGKARAWLARMVVPSGCLMASIGLAELIGPGGAGLMSTFPGVTLTLLILTHLEAGPGPAARLARAFPPGNLGMVAFLAAFRGIVPLFGLGWGTATGYLAAVVALATVARFGQDAESSPARAGTVAQGRPTRPRSARRFSPRMETIAA